MKDISHAKDQIARALDPDREHVELFIEGIELLVVMMEGFEKVSTLFSFTLTADTTPLTPPPFDLIGRPCEMTLHDGYGTLRSLAGLVAEAERVVRDDGTCELSLVMRPAVYPLSLSRDSRVFNDMSVPQIVDEVMKKTQAKHRWELSDSYRTRVYTAQYREDDWTFISRLLEEEGIYYWFDHEGAETVVVFSDDSRSAPELTGGAAIEFVIDRGMLANKETIHELAAEAHATPTKFTVGSFDEQNPQLKVEASQGEGVHEMYDAPGGGPIDPAVCAKKAQIRLEYSKCHRASESGNGNSVRIEPGRALVLYNHPLFDGRYFVTEVRYQARQRRMFQSAATGGYECHFELVSSNLRFRPPEDSPVVKQAGIQSGRVTGPPGEEIHIDARGRARVQLHWDREGGWDDEAGKWMRSAQRGVASSMLYPRVGWNVMTFMEEGNVDAPTILSRVHDAEHPPTYPLPEFNTRTVFRTLTSPGGGSANEVRMEDKAGLQELFFNASKDMNFQVNDRSSFVIGNDHSRTVGSTQEVTVAKGMIEEVMHDQSHTVTGNEELEIGEARSKSVENDETSEITGNRTLKVGSNVTWIVENDRKLTVTGVMEETTEGLTKVGSEDAKITIDAATTHKSDGLITVTVAKKHEQTIQSMKIEKCKQDRTLEVNNNFTETIKGSLFSMVGDNFNDGTDEITSWEVKNAMTGSTKAIFMEAKNTITLQVGTSTIKIDKTSITFSTDAYELGASSQLVSEAKIKHN